MQIPHLLVQNYCEIAAELPRHFMRNYRTRHQSIYQVKVVVVTLVLLMVFTGKPSVNCKLIAGFTINGVRQNAPKAVNTVNDTILLFDLIELEVT